MASSNVTEILLHLANPGTLKTEVSFNKQSSKDQELLCSLTSLAHDHQTIQRVVRKTRRSESILLRAIVCVLERHVCLLVEHVAFVEEMVLNGHEDLMVLGQISLIKLATQFRRFSLVLRHLRALAETIESIDRQRCPHDLASLSDRLREALVTGYYDLRAPTLELVVAVDKVYLSQIEEWCLHGSLRSRLASDYFIQLSQDGFYEYSVDHCPAYIGEELGRAIFSLGSILIRVHEKRPVQTGDLQRQAYISSVKTIFSGITFPIDGARLAVAINAARSSLSNNLLSLVLPQGTVLAVLKFLREIYLLECGEFAQELIRRTQEDFRSFQIRHPGLLKDDTVNAVLAKTLVNLRIIETESDSFLEHRSCLRMVLDSDADGQQPESERFAAFLYGVPTRLVYDYEWPLDVFLGESEMHQYGQLFNYLISLKRAHVQLHELWRTRRTTPELLEMPKTAWSAAFVTLSFLGVLLEYYQSDVLSTFSKELSIQLETGECHDDPGLMSATHRQALSILYDKVLLPRNDFPGVMRDLLSSVDLMLGAVGRISDLRLRCRAMEILVGRARAVLETQDGVDMLLLKLQVNTSLQMTRDR